MEPAPKPPTRWQLRRQLRTARKSFGGGREYQITVPPDPDGPPGERVTALSLPVSDPISLPSMRLDFVVYITPHATLAVRNLGRVMLGHGGDDTARDAVDRHTAAARRRQDPVTTTELLGDTAWTFRTVGITGSIIHEWHFEHAGWIWAASFAVMGKQAETEALAAAQALFDSWQWIDPAPEPTAPGPLWSRGG